MEKNKDKTENLELARYKVEEDEIVVHGAEIICSYGFSNKGGNHLVISDGHGFLQDGKNCAHDGSCVPVQNIKPFASCLSPYAQQALKALMGSATQEERARFQAALDIMQANNDRSYECDGAGGAR